MPQDTNQEDKELHNFDDEIGIPEPEEWEDYSQYKRNPQDRDFLACVWQVFAGRLFPVLALLYIAAVIGISLSQGANFLTSRAPHSFAALILLWVSIAPITWICMRCMIGEFGGQAQTWYFWIAGSQAVCGLLFYFLFPATEGTLIWGLQSFFVSSIPMHIVIYLFFVLRIMPQALAWPVTVSGIVFMLYGLLFI